MSRRQKLLRLRAVAPVILPSLLLCDFGDLRSEVRALEAANVQGLHLDVMDGRFVPNMTYGLPLVETFRRLTDLPLDVHLMIEDPARHVEAFVEAGADGITIHCEAVPDPGPVLAQIRACGAAAGLAVNPPTPISAVEGVLDQCDLVLVMSVMPGFGGQSFRPEVLDKLKALRSQIASDTVLEIDGGVNTDTIGDCRAAGADLFVVGSGIFRTDDYTESVSNLTRLAGGS